MNIAKCGVLVIQPTNCRYPMMQENEKEVKNSMGFLAFFVGSILK